MCAKRTERLARWKNISAAWKQCGEHGLFGRNRNKGPLGLFGAVAILRSAAWKRDPGGKDCGIPTGSRREPKPLAASFASPGRRLAAVAR
jgi:hypothetical protein